MTQIPLHEAARRVNRDPSNEDSVGWRAALPEALGVRDHYDLDWDEIEKRLKCYWLHRWYCTDSFVGLRVYWFDDKPLAVSLQSGRRMSEEVEFLDADLARETRAFLLSLLPEPEFPMLDQDETIALDHAVSYTGQLLDYEGFVDGKPVSLDPQAQRNIDRASIVASTVVLPDGTKRPITDFRIPLKII